MTYDIPNLKIEPNEDGTLTLEQDWCGDIDRVTVHPFHLRFMAFHLGLAAEPSATDANLVRVNAALKRRLRTLLQRIDHLDDWLRQAEAKGHEDLSMETCYSYATWELAHEFCADLDQLDPCAAPAARVATSAPETQEKPTGNPAVTQRVTRGEPASTGSVL